MKISNIFQLRDTLQGYGFWYTLWFHGVSFDTLWCIFVAWQMIRYENKVSDGAQRAHADWYYEQQLK
jgi:hypothetical protein